MAIPAEKRPYTVEEYLELELHAEEKHEFHDGEILAMSGGTYESSIITANLIRLVGNALRGTNCFGTDSNLRVRPLSRNRYFYPDMMIICGKPEFDPRDKQRMTITNPTVVIEVLSPSTAEYDRGRKFDDYRELSSMQEYVLVSQAEPRVESFPRQPDASWAFAPYTGLEATAKLRSINIALRLAELYEGVEWPPTEI